MKRPVTLWILIFWLVFLAFGGLYGGIAMLLDPSGGSLQMTEVLPVLATWFIRQVFLIFRRKFRQPILLFPPSWSRFFMNTHWGHLDDRF